MALTVDIMHGQGLSNEMHRQLQPKETKAVKAVTITAKGATRTKARHITLVCSNTYLSCQCKVHKIPFAALLTANTALP